MEYEPSKEDLDHLREWLKKMPHIVQDYDDTFLAAFVRGCKGSLQKTKTCLENVNALGMKYPDLFGNMDPLHPELHEHLQESFMFPLPRKSEKDLIVSLQTPGPDYKGDPYKYHPMQGLRYWEQWFYIFLWENKWGEGKGASIIDYNHLGITHFRDATPMNHKIILQVLKDTLPVRAQAVHLINIPSFLEWVINLAKGILPKKLSDRIHCHNNYESLHSHFSKEILPKEFGGDAGTLAELHEEWKKKVESYRSRLLEEEAKMRALDSIRKKTMNMDDDMAGTFRNLNVD